MSAGCCRPERWREAGSLNFAHELSGGTQQRVGAFPTDEIFRTEASEAVKAFFEAVTTGGSAFFGSIAYIIRVILDFLEIVFVETPWIVVASLIGAKGLGEDVLEALQYASVGQGILAGFAILFCALILDRIVAGAKS